MSSSNKTEDYEVGYKKPPRKTQFPKGQSGNAKGRPKGAKGLSQSLLGPLLKKVQITEKGHTRNVSQVEAFMMLQTKMALSGDAAAANRLIRMLPLLSKIAEAEAQRETTEDGSSRVPDVSQTDKDILRHFAEMAVTGEFDFDEENADD